METDHRDDIQLAPVAGWEIGTAAGEAIILRLSYLLNPLQAQPLQSPTFVIGRDQAIELAHRILALSQKLQSAAPPDPGQPRH